MKRTASISDHLKPLAEAPIQAYLTNDLQVADVLEWVLGQVGVSEVWQTSFSISEEFLRRLYFISKSGKISRFNLVLDHKATNKTLKLWVFINELVERTFLADNHSKVLLVKSQDGQVVSIITSQNLTRGNRHESAVVTTEENIFYTLYAQIEELIKSKSVPLSELLNQRLEAAGEIETPELP